MWGAEYGRAFGDDTAKARRFGVWIARRYAGMSHVLWIVSGEHDSINGYRVPITDAQRSVLTAVAEGLRSVHGGAQLTTIHPGVARTSSLDFHAEEWLDLNMLQSGHCIDCEEYGLAENHDLIAHDWGLTPTKPVLDGEPIYEDTPDGVWMRNSLDNPRADAAAVRRKAYWSVFAGACGHVLGVRRELRLRGESVVERRNQVASAEKAREEARALGLRLVPLLPRSPVHPHEHGRLVGAFGHVEVEAQQVGVHALHLGVPDVPVRRPRGHGCACALSGSPLTGQRRLRLLQRHKAILVRIQPHEPLALQLVRRQLAIPVAVKLLEALVEAHLPAGLRLLRPACQGHCQAQTK